MANLDQERTPIALYRKRRTALDTQFANWKPHLQDINDYILPRARFQPLADSINAGAKKYRAIVNNAGLQAIRTSTAGLVSGFTPPGKPWKRLTTPDPDLAEYPRVREWLHVTNERQLTMYGKSNLYQCLVAAYFDLLAFGVTLVLLDEDDETVMRGYHAPVGSYVLACSKRGRVDTAMRDVVLTVRQLVNKFGVKTKGGLADWSVFTDRVKNLYDKGDYDERIEVCHVFEPNENYRPGRLTAKEKPFRSCWYEKQADDLHPVLKESGFSENRILAPRWMVLGDDTYGTSCPGMEMLDDVKALQSYEKEKALIVELLGRPPTAVPHGMTKASLMPGRIVNMPVNAQGNQQAYPLVQANPAAVKAIQEDIAAIVSRINRVSYADLWLTLTLSPSTHQQTAEEIRAIVEEKIIQIAPNLLRLNDELLDPLDDTSFEMMWRAGLIPEPPPELQGVALKTEYVSPLQVAQQYAELGGLERLAGFVTSIIEWAPEARLKVKVDEWLDQYVRTLGLAPSVIADDEEFGRRMDAQQKAQQAAVMQQTVETGANAANKLANAPTDTDNALTRIAEATGSQGPLAA